MGTALGLFDVEGYDVGVLEMDGEGLGSVVVGSSVGDIVGDCIGDVVGDCIGEIVGDCIGDVVGEKNGDSVGDTVLLNCIG